MIGIELIIMYFFLVVIGAMLIIWIIIPSIIIAHRNCLDRNNITGYINGVYKC